MTDVNGAYILGQQLAMREGNDREREKIGTLRAGNTGMVMEDGRITSVCAARTYLRQQGIDTGDNDEDNGTRLNRELMFEAGRTNEDIWAANLTRAGLTIKREEEIPTSWFASNGKNLVTVSGRPDLVVVDPDTQQPIRGLELKLISSLWKAKSTRFNKKPSMEHLLQAGHYSWQLQVPFELWYTCRATYAVTGDWVQRMFPKYGEPGSEDCSYSFFRNRLEGYVEIDNPAFKKDFFDKLETKEPLTEPMTIKIPKLIRTKIDQSEWEANEVRLTGMSGWKGREQKKTVPEYEAEIKAVLPFRQGFAVEWNADGHLEYAEILPDGSKGPWIDTIITVERIERFYNYVAEMGSMNQVPEPPLNLEADGQKGNFALADYCSLGRLCCKYQKGSDLGEWKREVEEQVKVFK